MTREEAILKLLSVEPETKDQIILATGWPADETAAVLDKLLSEHRVSYDNGRRGYGHGRRLYFPKAAA